MSVTKQCSKCSHQGEWSDKFCRQCGGGMQEVRQLPYVGENPKKGIYRITITIEREFRHQDHADECAGKSMLGEDEVRFADCDVNDIKVKFLRTTVGRETHPWECRSCRDEANNAHDRKNPYVSHTDQGRCEGCGHQDWVKRK